MSPCLRFRSCILSVITTLTLALTSVPLGDAAAVAPDEARWKNGELLAPLPSSPEARATAIEQAIAFGRTRVGARPATKSVTYASSANRAPLVYANRVASPASSRVTLAAEPDRGAWLRALDERLRESEQALAGPGAAAPAPDGANAPSVVEFTPPPKAAPLSFGFDGIDDTGLDPASPDIAVGPNHILIAANDRFAVMDKCGTTLYTDLLRTFFGQPATRTYHSPKVLYDPWTPRWIMIFVGTENNFSESVLYLAVSETADPLGPWYHYDITTFYYPGLRDDPSVAVTPDEVYITWNQFNLSTFAFEGARLLELVKSEVYTTSGVALYSYFSMTNPNDASLAVSVRPAQMRTYGGDMYFVNNQPFGDDYFTLWELSGPPGASTLTGYNVFTGAYATPSDMAQPNATLVDAGDCRVCDAVYASGKLYAAFTLDDSGAPVIQTEQIDVVTLALAGIVVSGADFAYPTIDIDENDQLTWAYAVTSAVRFLSIDYLIVSFPLTLHDSGSIYSGLANFAVGGQPYRWGHFFGAALDPADSRTVWIHGTYASDSPLNSWTTRVGAVTAFTPSNLSVTALTSTYVAGLEGGPFAPDQIDFDLENTGSTTATWRVLTMPTWLSIAEQSGSLDPGASQTISFFVNGTAAGYAPGTYPDVISIGNCTGDGGGGFGSTLAVGVDGWCPGAQLTLTPPTTALGGAFSGAPFEVGAFVTAIEDVEICAIGIEAAGSSGQDLVAKIYSADGATRGGLWASSSPYTIVTGLNSFHIIPFNASLSACSEYDIAVAFETGGSWPTWDDPATEPSPLDIGGLVRVRDAEFNGNAADTRLPRIVLFTTNAACANTTDLAASAGLGFTFSANDARGLYVVPQRTMQLCSLGLNADLVPGTTLRARIYTAAGAVRTALVAEGAVVVSSPLFTFHDVPISQVLLAGSQYDLEIEFENNAAWESYDVPPATLPYVAGSDMLVYGAEQGGTITTVIPHLRVAWSEPTPGSPFDLAKQGDVYPPPFTSTGTLAHGAYITSLIGQEVYGIGVMADIPQGGFLTAYLYDATGTTRGPLVSTAVVTSDGPGMQWHDVPISASLVAAGEYDIMFASAGVDEWPYWSDASGLPYTAYGTIQVRNGESSGNPGGAFLAHMRVHACNATLTDVVDRPQRVPMLLEPPAPNPTTGMVRFGYAVDETGDVRVAIYDVRGRKVADVVHTRRDEVGVGSVDFDTTKLASGVYFVKLTTRTKSTSRKFVVTH